VLWSTQKEGTALDYIAHVSRGSDNVATHSVEADSDVQAFDLAIEWATSLLLAADDDVVLAIQLRREAPSKSSPGKISEAEARGLAFLADKWRRAGR
jgi:hypothetical protein